MQEWLDWGDRQRRARRRPELHFVHARRADAARAGRSAAVLDAARLDAPVARARPRRGRPASSRASCGARSRSGVCPPKMPPCSVRWPRSRFSACSRSTHYLEHPGESALRRCGAMVHPELHSSARARRHDCTGVTPETVNRFLSSLPPEHQLTLIADLVGALERARRRPRDAGVAEAGDQPVTPVADPDDRRARRRPPSTEAHPSAVSSC